MTEKEGQLLDRFYDLTETVATKTRNEGIALQLLEDAAHAHAKGKHYVVSDHLDRAMDYLRKAYDLKE